MPRIIIALLAALLVVGALMWFANALSTGDWNPFGDTPTKKTDWRNAAWIATPAATLVVAVVVAVIAVDQQQTRRTELKHTEKSLQQNADNAASTHQLADISALRDRYTTAAEQLGSPSSAIRLAGVYAMAALADDWADRDRRDETQTCIDVPCAYLRTPRLYDRAERQRAASAAEHTVRQAIVATIATHLQPTAARAWRELSLDLRGAVFDFDASFEGAVFSGGQVSFNGAEFSSGQVSFNGAEFSSGQVSFNGAEFSSGQVSFNGAEFSHQGLVLFRLAEFSGGRVSFSLAKFSGGRVSFTGVEFSGGGVSFTGVEFSGGGVSFDRATLSAPDWMAFKQACSSTETTGADPNRG